MQSTVRSWGCCGGGPGGDGWAVRGSWFAIEQGQLFALLGPNGAGKTTTINMLTGVIPASGGDALIHGGACHARVSRYLL